MSARLRGMKRFTQSIGLLVIAAFCLCVPAGCNRTTLAPGGTYAGDKALYNADKSITTSYRLFQTFLKWETQYRAVLPVEVSRGADTVRLNAKKWIQTASALRDAYAATPTPQNKDKLQLALNIIDTALAEAAKYMADFQTAAPNKGLVAEPLGSTAPPATAPPAIP